MSNKRTMVIIMIIFLSSVSSSSAESLQAGRKLDFVFLLHANQALVPYGDVANDLNYRGVLETLRAHPSINVTIHISGTLTSVLQMFSPETLQLIQDGVDDGQFELVGSAYSQNVMYSQYTPGSADSTTGDFDNDLQLRLHQQVLKNRFGIKPTTFWNPERVWDPDLILPVIKNAGYDTTFIEDHIIQKVTNSSEYLVRTTGDPNKPLYVLSDDRDLIWNESSQTIGPVDKLARGPQGVDPLFVDNTLDEIMNYLGSVYQQDVNDEMAVVYAQDMEAWGLWQEEGRSDAGGSWADDLDNVLLRLDALLTRFEQETGWLQISHPAKVIEALQSRSYSFEHINTIPFGEAKWMTYGAQSAGYASWKAWQDGFGGNYRLSFTTARNDLISAKNAIDDAVISGLGSDRVNYANRVLNYMEFIYAANQFEFGCWGCDFSWWNRVETVGIGNAAIDWILADQVETVVYSKDLDHDSFSEYIIRDNNSMYVFARQGGRLVGWFDKNLGDILIYNDAAATYTTGGSDNHQDFIPDISSFWGRSTKEFALRQKGMADYPRYNFTSTYPSSIYSYSTFADTLTLSTSGSDASVTKKFSIVESGKLHVEYTVGNKRSDIMPFSMVSFFSPSNLDMLLNGMDNVDYIRSSDNMDVGVINTERNVLIGIEAGNNMIGTSHRVPGMFSAGLQYDFEPVSPSGISSYAFDLVAATLNYPLAQDIIPPTLSVLSPDNNTEYKSLLEFDVEVSDDNEFDRVELIFDGKVVDWRTESGVLQFYDNSLSNGSYVFTIRAFDSASNSVEVNMIMTFIGEKGENVSTTSKSPFPLVPMALIVIIMRKRKR